jgi:hypothetical protein
MKKTSPTYTVKKQKDGDYEVTLYNQTKVFSLKDVMLQFMEAQKQLKEVGSQRNLDKAVHQNIKDHHSDVIKMFEKLPKVKRVALVNYIEMFALIEKSEKKYKEIKRVHDRLKNELAEIHAVIPQEEKELTRAEKAQLKNK